MTSESAELEAADVLLHKAWSANNAGRPALALTRYRRLLTRLPERPAGRARTAAPAAPPPAAVDSFTAIRVRAMLGTALATYELDADLTAATATLDEAEALARAGGMPGLVAAVVGQHGLLSIRSGEYDRAIRILDRAVRIGPRAEPVDLATALLNRGSAHVYRGEVAAAAADFRRASTVAAQIGDRLLQFKTEHNLGYCLHLEGDLPGALRQLQTARRLDPEGPRPMALLGEARVLLEAGLHTDVDDILIQAANGFARAGLRRDVAETLLTRAENALRNGKLEQAGRLATEAGRRFARRDDAVWVLRADIVRMRVRAGRLLAAPGPRPAVRARRLLEALAAVRDRLERPGDRQAVRDVEVLMMSVESLLPAADRHRALRLHADERISTRLELRTAHARRLLADGHGRRAGSVLSAAHGDIAAHQNGLASAELRAGMAGWITQLAEVDVERAMRTGQLDDVFHSVDRWRSRLSTRIPVRPPDDPETAELLTELRLVSDSLAEATPGQRPDPVLRRRERELEGKLRRQAWASGSEHQQADVAAAVDLQGVLDATGWGLLTVFLHREQLVMLSRPAGGRWLMAPVRWAVQGLRERMRADADLLARGAPDRIHAVARASYASSLNLMDPVLFADDRLDPDPLLVLCDPALAMLPWGLMPSRRGKPTVVSSSADTFVSGRAARPDRSGAATPTVALLGGPGLVASSTELRAIESVWPEASVLDQATAAQALAAFASADLVHVAAHGTHSLESPLFSWLRMADGPLYAHEVDTAAVPDAVVLSACDLGLTTLRSGAGLGWSTALRQLGCRSTIASTAAVADAAVATAMGRLHASLAAGADTATALAETAERSWREGALIPMSCFGSTVTVAADLPPVARG